MEQIISNSVQEILGKCARPELDIVQLTSLVKDIFETVKTQGDKGLLTLTEKFDGLKLQNLKLNESELAMDNCDISEALKNAIKIASANIEKFHTAQKPERIEIETMPGVKCWQESRPIEKIGIYIPGGTAPLFSTVLMLAIPAKIAGCKEVVLCTPPNKSGNIDPAILYAAALTGVKQVFKVGGAQAIAAMSLGTETIPKVNKIFGPGNQYVTAAKSYAQQMGLAIDLPAGPSELMVVADQSADAEFIASDLLSQAEHGVDSQVICLVTSQRIVDNVRKALQNQLISLPRRTTAEKALENSRFIITEDKKLIVDVINGYAPEHLILCTNWNTSLMPQIVNAGSVFVGNYTPESAGDYASGTNHTLPTNGYAKAYSGVNLDAFVKKITFQEITKDGIQTIGSTIETMAEAEMLQAHKKAVSIRLKKIANEN